MNVDQGLEVVSVQQIATTLELGKVRNTFALGPTLPSV